MARGDRHHLKRLNAPHHWMLSKLGGTFAPKPSGGPHGMKECLPLILIMRNRLHYALNAREVQMILKNRNVKIDGKVRTDSRFPVGFMDVLSIPRTKEYFRLLYNTKRRFCLVPLSKEQSTIKLCKVEKRTLGTFGIPYIITHDGRTIRYPHPEIQANDTIKLDLVNNKIVDFVKFDVGNTAMLIGGNSMGRIGVVVKREVHPGSFEIVHIKDANGTIFTTRLANVFIIGKGTETLVNLPLDQGIKKPLIKAVNERIRKLKLAKLGKFNKSTKEPKQLNQNKPVAKKEEKAEVEGEKKETTQHKFKRTAPVPKKGAKGKKVAGRKVAKK
ncbi:40S ribosomal protein S4, putative [Entamoeba invadens IP1]|uniref:40S ribosomal protein S4, putative n=2 Tax=Entamoeba invadens TaxID=33085 RepID=L7FPH4_ENTIV|nr:40S ribosomal protein S4, putative [Entamoeba invadens IP1]XP_004258331.1 40S ribosomal protein S4, putative [Entamoeba invadens IP1]ELP86648.1 40S ribosomal protein S4, putative [Entamoeba invadens IP1]ELP91560.1 40S ribosomal protein S4, putative [Entamoeba invadens IP1]BAN41924.1 40S ribosomal protein S4, putative [Entamoeba invadens]|eukprot:XP_004185994.1 40S ribosomal protein S4, putative [Entamoeba invadens IP1]